MSQSWYYSAGAVALCGGCATATGTVTLSGSGVAGANGVYAFTASVPCQWTYSQGACIMIITLTGAVWSMEYRKFGVPQSTANNSVITCDAARLYGNPAFLDGSVATFGP